MTIGLLMLEYRLPGARSLKDKRRFLNSLKTKLGNKYNCSVAEVGQQDVWTRASLAVCVVSASSRHTNDQLNTIASFAGMNADALLEDYRTELL